MSNNNKESLRVRTANLEKELKALREKVDRLDESRGELRKIREENKKRNDTSTASTNKGAKENPSTGPSNNGTAAGPSNNGASSVSSNNGASSVSSKNKRENPNLQ
jgi:hypothetical protein